jgi:hypothetical protein
MKRLISLITLFVAITSNVNAQSYCGERFPAVVAHIFNKGVGFEAGAWHTEQEKLGFFIGMGVVAQTEYNDYTKRDEEHPTLYSYIKGQYRITDYVAATGFVGEQDFTNIWYGFGARFYFPLTQQRSSILILEPNMTNIGFKVHLGIGFAIK